MTDIAQRRHSLKQLAALAVACVAPVARAGGYEVSRWPLKQAVPQLQAADLNGKLWRLSELRGRAVLLNFWASWCEPCRAEMPALQQLADFYGPEKLLVLAINFKESATKAAQYAKVTGLSLPVLLDPAGDMARQWGVKVFRTTILIAADGQQRQQVRGEVDWTSQEAAKLVEPLFKR